MDHEARGDDHSEAMPPGLRRLAELYAPPRGRHRRRRQGRQPLPPMHVWPAAVLAEAIGLVRRLDEARRAGNRWVVRGVILVGGGFSLLVGMVLGGAFSGVDVALGPAGQPGASPVIEYAAPATSNAHGNRATHSTTTTAPKATPTPATTSPTTTAPTTSGDNSSNAVGTGAGSTASGGGGSNSGSGASTGTSDGSGSGTGSGGGGSTTPTTTPTTTTPSTTPTTTTPSTTPTTTTPSPPPNPITPLLG